MGMAAQMPDDKPKILMAHMTYQGADKGFDDLLMQHEPILTREAVAGFDLVCLGHIHKPQIIDGKVFYSGPIERLSFNEQDIHPGFWIHETGKNEVTTTNPHGVYSRFIGTPARRYVTLDWEEPQVQAYLDGYDVIGEIDIQDSIVRLPYTCSEEVAKQVNRKQLEQALYDAGAFYVSEIKSDIQRVDRARDTEVTESLGPVEALGKWCDNQGIDSEESKELQAMTAALLEVL
jgi:exonuclease SbcC/exonuclease SbcD